MEGKKGLLLGGLLFLGIGFAAVSTTLYLNGDVNISANNEEFDVKFTKAIIDNEDRTDTAISEDGKTITYVTKELKALNDKSKLDFEVTNNSSLYDAEVSIDCTSGEAGEYYQITKNVASSIPSKTTDIGGVEVQKIKGTTEDIEESFTCTLTAKALERTTKGEAKPVINQNIVNKDLECLKNKEAGSCTPGTEIQYNVNDSTTKTFYVLNDDGDKLTLQQRENTVTEIAWYADTNDNTKGPITALDALESATNNWDNVNTMNYTMGTTIFKDNAFTGCIEYNNCTTNPYTLSRKNVKARMITMQELSSIGCSNINETCPVWMYNYLHGATENGGTVDDIDWGYWTMSANTNNSSQSGGINNAWYISYAGRTSKWNETTSTVLGARAVIEISKR